jgi:hypothetical protein
MSLKEYHTCQSGLFLIPATPRNLAPPDFFLFGHIKQWIVDQEFTSPDELIA